MLNVVDEYTPECLTIEVRRHFTGRDVVNVLAELFAIRGRPRYLRSDNGPEFACRAVKRWLAKKKVGTLFIEPGSPWENGYIESFNGKFEDECLNGELFLCLAEARYVVDRWRMDYNTAAQPVGLDDAGGVLGTVPGAAASVCSSGFGYASPSGTHGKCIGLTLIQVGTEIRGRSERGTDDIEDVLAGHLLGLGSGIGFFEDIGNSRVRDVFGVVWDRSADKDIGVVEGCLLPEPTLKDYEMPNPLDQRFFADIEERIARRPGQFRVFNLGFSLYERAWTLRGMENLMVDFIEHPAFVHELLGAIADYNIAQVRRAMEFDIDAVRFGDDWGQQHGLQMGPAIWREFIRPQLARMYGAVRQGGRFVSIHSCGDVDELFDDLVAIGLNCFNPFQPEVLDVTELMGRYRGRLAFHGGLSTQRTLPYGTPADVRAESRRLLEMGREGGYIFSPAHAVEGDVPIENIMAFIEVAREQPGVAPLD